MNQILDPMSGKLICTFCDTEVEEDTSNGPKTDSRTMLAKYNTQVKFSIIQVVVSSRPS